MNNDTRNLATVNKIGLAVCLSLVGDLSLFAVLPTRYADAGITLLNLGLILSIHRLIRIPGNPFAGYIVDRWGRRKPFLLGMVFAFLSTAGYGLVHGLLPFALVRILWGIAWMFINVGALSMVIDLSQPTTRGACTGRMTAWYMVGLAIGPILGGFLVDLLGYKTAMLVCSVFPLTGLLISLRYIPDTRRTFDELPDTESISDNGSFFSKLCALPLQVWVVFILFLVVQFSGEGIILSTLSLKLQQTIAANRSYSLGLIGMATAGGLLLGFRSVTSAITTPFLGSLSDTRLGRRGVVSGGILLALIGFGLLSVSVSLVILLFGVVLTACGGGAVSAVIAAWLGDLVTPAQRGFVMGFYSTAGDIGSTLGPLTAYALLASGGLNSVYLLCAILFGVSLLVLWLPRFFQP